MAIYQSKILSIARLASRWQGQPSYILSSYISRRNLQEFPDLKLNNVQPYDHVLVLPEPINEQSQTNEVLRLPKVGEKELNFGKINVEVVFKGLSSTMCTFENFITDINNGSICSDLTLRQFLKDLESKLYPMDTAYNILTMLYNLDTSNYNHPEIYQLMQRYKSNRESKMLSNIRDNLLGYVSEGLDKLGTAEKKVLTLYNAIYLIPLSERAQDKFVGSQYTKHIRQDESMFLSNLNKANRLFSHTVDDPDILAAVSSDFDDCLDLHHRERTPLTVTAATYKRFMQVCPDRFVRENLWQTFNKRCSMKALPKYNNLHLINSLRINRRQRANILGYRNHVEFRLHNNMANSKQEILENLQILNEDNKPKLYDRLQELNDYAADNTFEDPNQLGIQEYDTDYWSHRYMHEIIIGKSETELKLYFPLKVVLNGVINYFKNYFETELKTSTALENPHWGKDLEFLEVERKGCPIGSILYDPYKRSEKRLTDPYYGRIRVRNQELNCLPFRFISTSYKIDPVTKQAQLSIPDVINLLSSFGVVLQRLLYNYDYYELNIHGALEKEASNLLPYLCVLHLLTDHRILQSFSDRGGSKPIDAELASRVIKAYTYFRSFRLWQEFYRAHLDLEVNSSIVDIKNVAKDVYSIYSPFSRHPDNYDYCAMSTIFVGPNDGTQYADLWSKQLANFCLTEMLSQANDGGSGEINTIRLNKLKEMNERLLDTLFDPHQFDTNQKLVALLGRRFEPAQASLGML